MGQEAQESFGSLLEVGAGNASWVGCALRNGQAREAAQESFGSLLEVGGGREKAPCNPLLTALLWEALKGFGSLLEVGGRKFFLGGVEGNATWASVIFLVWAARKINDLAASGKLNPH